MIILINNGLKDRLSLKTFINAVKNKMAKNRIL